MSMKHIVVAFIAPVALVAVDGHAVSAHAQETIRVVNPDTAINSHPDSKSDVVMIASAGTLLDVLGSEGDWRWVLLPPDGNRSRHDGYLLIKDVAREAAAKPARAARGSARSQRRADRDAQRQQQLEERRIEKAKRELEKAREDYDRVASHDAAAGTPSPDAPAPQK